MMESGKRALNGTQNLLDILNAVYHFSNAVNSRGRKVKSIAEEINITELTFFNYFQKKENTLRYMIGLWALDLIVLQCQNSLSGETAIRRIFQRTAEHVK